MIYIFITVCVLALVYSVFKKQLKCIAFNIVIGTMIIYIVNTLVPGLQVGINPVTVCGIGLLGGPGVIMIYTAVLIL